MTPAAAVINIDDPSYRASRIRREAGSTPKRRRRTAAQMKELRDALYQTARDNRPLSLRHLFYILANDDRAIIKKTENEYNNVGYNVNIMRWQGRIPHHWIVDNTRWIIRPATTDSWSDALVEAAQSIRLNIWNNLPERVEIWTEKDAVAGVIADITDKWNVPLMVLRGYASVSYLTEIALQQIRAKKPIHIYYFGDHDPDGKLIPEKAEQSIRRLMRQMKQEVDVRFHRTALTAEQVAEWNLPTRPTKKTKRGRSFKGDSTDLDALHPRKLQELVEECIKRHVGDWTLRRIELEDQAARETALRFIGAEDDGGGGA